MLGTLRRMRCSGVKCDLSDANELMFIVRFSPGGSIISFAFMRLGWIFPEHGITFGMDAWSGIGTHWVVACVFEIG